MMFRRLTWLEQAELLRMLLEGLQVGLRVSLEGSVEETRMRFVSAWSGVYRRQFPDPGSPQKHLSL